MKMKNTVAFQKVPGKKFFFFKQTEIPGRRIHKPVNKK